MIKNLISEDQTQRKPEEKMENFEAKNWKPCLEKLEEPRTLKRREKSTKMKTERKKNKAFKMKIWKTNNRNDTQNYSRNPTFSCRNKIQK